MKSKMRRRRRRRKKTKEKRKERKRKRRKMQKKKKLQPKSNWPKSPRQSEVVAGEEEPVMAVAAMSPNSVSRRNSLQGKITSLQVRGGDSDARWRRPRIGRVARGFVEGQESSESALSRRPGYVNRALHHPREEESRRCRSQSGAMRTATGCGRNWQMERGEGTGSTPQFGKHWLGCAR